MTTTPAPTDLDAIREKWTLVCGPCDAGLPGTCSHPDEDPRRVVSDLLNELAEAKAALDRVAKFADDMATWCSPYGMSVQYAERLREVLASPATTAEPAAQHGPSAHGRACCDQLPAHMLPTTALDCGGVKACDLCREWADEIHGATTAEPADDLPGMWEQADLTGGQTDTEPSGEPKATACNCFMRGGKHSFKCDLARNGRPPYDPSAEPAAS